MSTLNDDVPVDSSTAAAPSGASRVTTLLELVGTRGTGIGPREAERVTGIDRSAVSRLFRQLEALGWVASGDRGTYTVGPKLFSLAAAVRQHDSLWNAAEPLLRQLTETYDETTYLAVRRGDRVVFRDKVDCAQHLRYVLDLNEPFPFTTGAAGRAVMSTLDDDEIEAIIAGGLHAHTPDSVTDPTAYREMIEADRRRGFSYSRSGWISGGGGVASPFFNAGLACVGAITLSAPIDRLREDRAMTLGLAVREAAHSLSRRLGFRGDKWGPTTSTD